jgi:hypothetical protein
MAEKEKPNLKVLRAILVRGEHTEVGSVIPKSTFETRADWDDLCKMDPPRLEETDEKIGVKTAAAMPGTK